MFEDNNSYEEIVQRSLARVATDVDKREGSVIFNAVAPTSDEIAHIYVLLDALLENGYADTAEREYLIRRCKERGITPDPATYAILKAEFNMEIPLGNRFNLGDLNYVVVEFIGIEEEKYSYQLQCETAGTGGNAQYGELSAIDFVDSNMEGSIVELLIPAKDEEDTEVLRQRYLTSFTATPFGGNKDDYREKVKSIDGVDFPKIIPVWNGGGTVKLIIIDSEFNKPSDTLVTIVQNAIDPEPQGQGVGLAPIGHTVTVVGCSEVIINVSVTCVLSESYTWEKVKDSVSDVLEAYFLEIRKEWSNNEHSIVRITNVASRILSVEGIIDVQNTKINDSTENLILEFEEIPILGVVTNA